MVHILHDNTIHSENILIQIRIPSSFSNINSNLQDFFQEAINSEKDMINQKKNFTNSRYDIKNISSNIRWTHIFHTYATKFHFKNSHCIYKSRTLSSPIVICTLNSKTYLAWNRRMLKKAGQRWDTLAKISFSSRLSNVTAAIASSLCSFFFLLLDGVKTSHEVAIKQSVFSRETFASTYPRCKQTYRYTLQVCV